MKTCLDCGKEIGCSAKRCGSCASTFRNLNGGGNFKDGHTLNRVCIDCGTSITKQATRCEECSKVILIERMKNLAESRKGIALFTDTEKQCNTCKKILSLDNFYKQGLHYQSNCKDCCKMIHSKYVLEHRDEINKYNIEYNHKTGKSKFFGQGKRPKLNKPVKLGYKIYSPNWDERKKEIYARDNWCCQECGDKCNKPKIIQCHHIDYNTGNNLSINLITLCRSCHAITNIDRNFFQWYFEIKILQMIENKGVIDG